LKTTSIRNQTIFVQNHRFHTLEKPNCLTKTHCAEFITKKGSLIASPQEAI